MIPSEGTLDERTPAGRRSEIDVLALCRVVWSHKYIVAAAGGICMAIAIYMALTATPIFRAEVVIAEVRESGTGGLASLANQFGGLASIAGLNLGGTELDHERQAVLQSRMLVEEFVKRNGVAPLLTPGGKQASVWFAVQKFRKDVLNITEDKLKGVTSVTIDWPDPRIAASWANGFVALANELMRSRAINDAGRNIEYLNKQLAQTNVLEIQRVLYNLIESETKTLMLANGRVEYAFTAVDPAVPPELRNRPKRTLMVLSGLVIGLFLGSIVALIYDKFAETRVRQ